MSNKFAYLLSLVLIITILFLPDQLTREPLKNNPEANLRKRIARVITEKPKFKAPEKSFTVPSPQLKKEDSQDRVMASALRVEINRSINQGIKNIRIVLNTTGDTDKLENMVENCGGKILRERPDFMAVEVPADKAEQLIEGNSSIEYARLPFKFFPAGKVTEGVNLTGANIFNDTIYRGAGVKIAVLDVGFKGLTVAISHGELPSDVKTRDFSGLGLQTEYKHGTACAEIIHDMAPDAQLYLLKMGDEIAGYDAIDYCIENNINIVSLSVGTFGTGPGDGTGPVDEAFDQLRDAGILVVAAAGNYGNASYQEQGTTLTTGSHWEGAFTDANRDMYNEFKPTDSNSDYNVIGAYPTWDDDGNPSTSEVTILMRWDDWPVSDIDYDMYLYSYDYDNQKIGDLVASSTIHQSGTQPPVEYISMNIPDSATDGQFFALKVKKRTAETPSGIKLEIYLGGTSAFVPFTQSNGTVNTSVLAQSTGSIDEPADAESVLAVGAIDYTKWTTGPQEDYSSQGPTNDWNWSIPRIKPDIMGPDGVTTYTYGDSSFYGTSAATPHVAGIAALILSVHPGMTADELQQLLEDDAVDMGTLGDDNQYGWGRIQSKFTFPIVKSYQKIGNMEGNFTGILDVNNLFGWAVASIGDLNGDGIIDLAAGAPGDSSGGLNIGAVYILFMYPDGTVKSYKKISKAEGNFTGILDDNDNFGSSVASIGDFNGDGIGDLAVGAPGDDDGGSEKGAVWILFMNTDGTVKSHTKISSTVGNFTGTLNTRDNFGSSIASIGDLNRDGIGDLAVGAERSTGNGAVWIIFMNKDGTVKSYQKINSAEGSFTGYLSSNDRFASSVAYIGDLNGDGIGDLAVGAKGDSDIDYTYSTGAVWILFMNTNGTVKSYSKISNAFGNFSGELDDYDYFGGSLAYLGDFNADETVGLAVGADRDDDGGFNKGGVWILFLNTDGTVKSYQKISDTQTNFTGALSNGDSFGSSVAAIGDLNGDGVIDLAVGAAEDEYGGHGYGSVWIISLGAFPFDKDHDGMLDSWELQFGLNANVNDAVSDPDSDGLTNINEFKAGTNPKVADTDNDGMPDGWEIKYSLNPLINDAEGDPDGDGLINVSEYKAGTNPNDADTDNDGMPDGWEVQHGLDPLVNDAEGDLDGDGFSNIKEYQDGTLPDDPKSRPKRGMPWLQLLLGD